MSITTRSNRDGQSLYEFLPVAGEPHRAYRTDSAREQGPRPASRAKSVLYGPVQLPGDRQERLKNPIATPINAFTGTKTPSPTLTLQTSSSTTTTYTSTCIPISTTRFGGILKNFVLRVALRAINANTPRRQRHIAGFLAATTV